MNSFADNMELFPYFSIRNAGGQSQTLAALGKGLDTSQDFFDIDHLAILENGIVQASSAGW